MRFLVDTSLPPGFCALVEKDQILNLETLKGDRQALLGSLVDEFSSQKLTSIAVGRGPGSHVGTRAAISYAQGLAEALSIPLFPFCSLLPFLPPCDGLFALYATARSGKLWVCRGQLVDGNITDCQVITGDRSLLIGRELTIDCATSPPYHLLPLCRWLDTTPRAWYWDDEFPLGCSLDR